MRRGTTSTLAAALGVLMSVAAWSAWSDRAGAEHPDDRFDHLEHKGLFPACQGCHEIEGARVSVPEPSSCASCHDGDTLSTVDWEPSSRPPSNLTFDHARVIALELEELGVADRPCESCHTPAGGDRYDVHRAVVDNCLDCHEGGAEHLTEAPCEDCHIALIDAADYTSSQLAGFPEPAEHKAADFLSNHAPPEDDMSRCTICHARESCSSCHVNAMRVAAIQSLAKDPRVAALMAEKEITYPTPEDHLLDAWPESHALAVEADGIEACETCHARNSCQACHLGPQPASILALPTPLETALLDRDASGEQARSQERGPGVAILRTPPASHTPGFEVEHRAPAAAASASCETCHTQEMCVTCHTGSEAVVIRGRLPGRYHPPNFMQQHSASAFGQAVECATCHNTEAFCRDCHSAQGLTTGGRFDTGFHNAASTFVFGHGQAARQGLEACASCHTQRDCIVCHSAKGGRRVNPHGPGFDADRLRDKNPDMCLFCHTSAILGR